MQVMGLILATPNENIVEDTERVRFKPKLTKIHATLRMYSRHALSPLLPLVLIESTDCFM